MGLSQSPLKVGDRFATTLFLLGNGVLPRAIAAYLAGSGLLSDPSAHAHVWCVMRDFRDGALRSDAQCYCMRLQCNVRVHDRDSLWCGGVPADMSHERRNVLGGRPANPPLLLRRIHDERESCDD